MVYVAPYIDESGLHIPTYQDVEDYLVDEARNIFGSDIYLAADSQDFQYIAAQAKVIYDTLLTAQLCYNNRSPVTAIGTALDGLVAINGIQRRPETNSTAPVTLAGTAFTVITNGLVSDINGNTWELPETVTLDSNGEAAVTATCQTAGAITALVGQINIILTPTLGWTSVTNPNAATPGRAEATDAELRARQAVSVANPSQALTTGIRGAVLAVDGVAGVQLYENDTSGTVMEINGVPAPYGYPANSITVVVDGGDNEDVAQAIYERKTPGCYTNGDVEVVVTDEYGVPTTIRFTRPDDVSIEVSLTIRALTGYTSAIGDAVIAALVEYITGLEGGTPVIISELWQAALSADTGALPTFSLLSLSANRVTDTAGTTDITLDYDEKATTVTGNIELIVT